MALVPVLKLLKLDEDSASMVVVDDTGNYSGTNTGGFGTPNPAKVDVLAVILQLASFENLTAYSVYRFTDTTDLFSAEGMEIGASDFGGTAITDGVYNIKYDLAVALGAITIEPGTKNFTLANADTVLAGCAGIILSGDTDRIYYLDMVSGLTNTGGKITENWPSDLLASQTNSQKVFEGTLKFLADRQGDKCLTDDIVIWSDNGCEGVDYRDVWKRYQMKIAMETMFLQAAFAKAHHLARKLSAYCTTSNVCKTC